MSLTFSRSMRSLRLDSFRATRIGLALAALNMLVLIGWFFLAKVNLYEVSSTLAWEQDRMLSVSFPKEALARLRQGQPATVRLNLGADQPGLALPAYLYRLPEGDGRVLFYVTAADLPDNLPKDKLTGLIEVEVERITPAELVLRSSGKYLTYGPAAANGQPTPQSP
jgi:hypothetical protein